MLGHIHYRCTSVPRSYGLDVSSHRKLGACWCLLHEFEPFLGLVAIPWKFSAAREWDLKLQWEHLPFLRRPISHPDSGAQRKAEIEVTMHHTRGCEIYHARSAIAVAMAAL
jgi:hypothetical protein